mgnify:CR=1 FL=1
MLEGEGEANELLFYLQMKGGQQRKKQHKVGGQTQKHLLHVKL